MSFGAQVFDENQKEVFNTDMFTTSYMGEFIPSTRSGSFLVADGFGEVWAHVSLNNAYNGNMGTEVWVVGSTIHWQMFFSQVGQGVLIQYGRYSR